MRRAPVELDVASSLQHGRLGDLREVVFEAPWDPHLNLVGRRLLDPDHISAAGWLLVLRGDERWQNVRNDADFAALATHLDGHDLTLTLLRESPVFDRAVERALTRLRRWLLISGQSHGCPRLVEALKAQAILNGLRLISFLLPTVDAVARYDARYPHDPRHRDMAAWAQFEKSELPIYAGLYAFMCRKPLAV